jgi:hypothetical protein
MTVEWLPLVRRECRAVPGKYWREVMHEGPAIPGALLRSDARSGRLREANWSNQMPGIIDLKCR